MKLRTFRIYIQSFILTAFGLRQQPVVLCVDHSVIKGRASLDILFPSSAVLS